jgi:hypothetical protein
LYSTIPYDTKEGAEWKKTVLHVQRTVPWGIQEDSLESASEIWAIEPSQLTTALVRGAQRRVPVLASEYRFGLALGSSASRRHYDW